MLCLVWSIVSAWNMNFSYCDIMKFVIVSSYPAAGLDPNGWTLPNRQWTSNILAIKVTHTLHQTRLAHERKLKIRAVTTLERHYSSNGIGISYIVCTTLLPHPLFIYYYFNRVDRKCTWSHDKQHGWVDMDTTYIVHILEEATNASQSHFAFVWRKGHEIWRGNEACY